jgi:hypothetical protein
MLVVEKEGMGEFAGRAFLGFEKLTHIPLQVRAFTYNSGHLKALEASYNAIS